VSPLSAAASTLCCLAPFITLSYAGLCSVSPFGKCRKCSGTGREHHDSPRRARKHCRRCHGHGIRLRPGRRVINAVTALHRDGTK
jgi:DnaJ-class molecular chaperone